MTYIMDHYILILFVSLYVLVFDKLGLWKFVISFVGNEPFVHLFFLTYLIINIVFFSIGLFLTHFDLKTIHEEQLKKVKKVKYIIKKSMKQILLA